MDAVREFLTALQTERGASPHTLAAYRRDLTGFVTFLGRGGRAVATARVGDLTEYLAALRRRGLGARSTARHLSAVRGLYRFLLGSGGIRRDPTEHLETPRPPRRLPRTLSVEDAAALVEAPDISVPEGLRDRALLELMYASGLRASECLTLRLEDLNQAAGYVMATGKGSRQRLVPVGGQALRWVQRYIATSRSGFVKRGDPGLLFLNRYGRPLSRQGLSPSRPCSAMPTSRPPRSTRICPRPRFAPCTEGFTRAPSARRVDPWPERDTPIRKSTRAHGGSWTAAWSASRAP